MRESRNYKEKRELSKCDLQKLRMEVLLSGSLSHQFQTCTVKVYVWFSRKIQCSCNMLISECIKRSYCPSTEALIVETIAKKSFRLSASFRFSGHKVPRYVFKYLVWLQSRAFRKNLQLARRYCFAAGYFESSEE